MKSSPNETMADDYFKDVPAHIFEPVGSDKILEIAIIGAGIAGLAAAAGLLQSGHDVEACISLL